MVGMQPAPGTDYPGTLGPGAPQPPSAWPLSSAPKVFGVLSIVFASLILLLNLPMTCGGFAGGNLAQLGQFAPHGEELPPELLQKMFATIGTVYTTMGVMGLIFLAMSGWLLGIGIGQVKYRAWAAKQSVVWGVAGIGCVVIFIGIMLAVVGPAYAGMFEAIAEVDSEAAWAGQMMGGMGSLIGGWTGFVMAVFYLPYPILLLVMFRKENVRAAMVA